MRFTGNIPAKADSKGRLFLPAAFRKVLQVAQEERLVMRRDVFQPCLVLYPESVWNAQVDALTARTPMFDRRKRALLRQFVADAEVLALDGDGRILLPRRYMEMAAIKKDVRFLGVDNTVEIWAKEKSERPFVDNDEFADALEAMMTDRKDGDNEQILNIDDYK